MEFWQTLEKAMADRGLTVAETARRCGLPDSTVRGILTRRQKMAALDVAMHLAEGLDLTLEELAGTALGPQPSAAARALARRYDLLDGHGREVMDAVAELEEARMAAERVRRDNVTPFPTRRMKRFLNRATAGPGSYLFDDGYEEIDVPADTPGDFIVTISGDSMEPYIRDGEDVYVTMGAPMQDGDVGIFLYDGSTYCKQYSAGYGYVYLFSLNRARADMDVVVDTRSGLDVTCFGKVHMTRRPPLPR